MYYTVMMFEHQLIYYVFLLNLVLPPKHAMKNKNLNEILKPLSILLKGEYD